VSIFSCIDVIGHHKGRLMCIAIFMQQLCDLFLKKFFGPLVYNNLQWPKGNWFVKQCCNGIHAFWVLSHTICCQLVSVFADVLKNIEHHKSTNNFEHNDTDELICFLTFNRLRTVVSGTWKYDEPEGENVTRGRSPSVTFSAEGRPISMSHKWLCVICFVVWPTTKILNYKWFTVVKHEWVSSAI